MYFRVGNGSPLHYSYLENPRDRGAWWAAVYGVAKSRTWLKRLSSSSSSSRIQQYVNQELPGIQPGFRKGKGARDQIANTWWMIEKAREFQKSIDFCFIDYSKAFECVYHNKLRKILKEMLIPDHLTWLLRNLHADQEATVRTRHGKTDWLKIRKGVGQDCISSLCLFNFNQSISL